MEKFEQRKLLQVEQIKSPEGDSSASFAPERGGIITSLKFHGREMLYLDEETFRNTNGSVRGGIPILFPNAGPIPDGIKTEELKNLKRHGFARDSKWGFEKIENGFQEILISNEETKKIFPYDFKLSIICSFENENSFTLKQVVENTGTCEMPVSSGLHPYFKVQNSEKKNIKFDSIVGDELEKRIEKWANGEYISIPNPDMPIRVIIPELGTLVLNFPKEYKRIWVWSEKGKDFICIEPVVRDVGGIINDPLIIKPKEKKEFLFNISLEK